MNRKLTAMFAAAMMSSAPIGAALAQDGDGTRVDDRVERRQDRRAVAADNYEGDGTRVDDRVDRRQDRRDYAADNAEYDGDGTRVDDRVDRRETRRDARQN